MRYIGTFTILIKNRVYKGRFGAKKKFQKALLQGMFIWKF